VSVCLRARERGGMEERRKKETEIEVDKRNTKNEEKRNVFRET
jgi:hypothetical protein